MNEKLVLECMALGCKNRKEAEVCLQIYLDLLEIKKYWDVQYKFHHEFGVYVVARKEKSEDNSVFIPKAATTDLSYRDIFKYFILCEHSIRSIYISIVHPDSTCVYYKLSEGLSEPKSALNKAARENHHQVLDAEIQRNRKILEDAAMHGLPISISKSDKDQAKHQKSQLQP